MKYIILIIVILSFAGIVESAHIADLQFLPKKGTYVLDFGIVGGGGDDNVDVHAPGNQKNKFYKIANANQNTVFEAGYSFADIFYLSGVAIYNLRNDDLTTYQNGSTIEGAKIKRKSSGFVDPAVSVKYRTLLEGVKQDFFIDTSLSYSPKTGKREYASTTKEGNSKRGGHAYSFLVEFGRPQYKLPLLIFIELNHYFKSKGIDQFDQSEIITMSNNSWSLGFRLQFPTSNKVYFSLLTKLGAKTDLRMKNLGTITTFSQRRVFDHSVSVDIELIKNTLLWSNTVGGSFSTYELQSSSLNMNGDRSSIFLKIGLRYQF